MTDVGRERFARLMQEIEDLEEKAAALKKDAAARQEVERIEHLLAERRSELSRLSDGCKRPWHE